MRHFFTLFRLLPGLLLFSSFICASQVSAGDVDQTLGLESAVVLAQQSDPWLAGSIQRQEALSQQGVAAAQLPDPTISLSAANLPVDDFDIHREPMTQFKVGLSQSFPRGDTRRLKQQRLDIMGSRQVDMREDRRAAVRMQVSTIWLDAYRNRQAIRLIEKDRSLFEYLVDVAEASYRSAAGMTRQQDLVRAQLELTRLDDRLTALQQKEDATIARLGEWVPMAAAESVDLGDQLPSLALATQVLAPQVLDSGAPDYSAPLSDDQLASILKHHPLISGLDKKIAAGATDVALAKQQYRPQWAVNSSYAYRDDDLVGNDRSDFFSLGVSFDLPLFTTNRQDRTVRAAEASEEALKTDKALALRSLRARVQKARSVLARLDQRQALYNDRLLAEIHDQAEASLSAYTNDVGDFAEVVRARIAELNAKIDFLNINIDRLQTIVELNYLLAPLADSPQQGVAP